MTSSPPSDPQPSIPRQLWLLLARPLTLRRHILAKATGAGSLRATWIALGVALGLTFAVILVYPAAGAAIGLCVLLPSLWVIPLGRFPLGIRLLRVPVYVIEVPASMLIGTIGRAPSRWRRLLLRWLPFRRDELAPFRFPGLQRLLVDVAADDPALASQLIDEAAHSVGQQRVARAALIELQARSLERAARNRLWSQAMDLALPFMPAPEDATPELRRFMDAARDLNAAGMGPSHRRRRRHIEAARESLQSWSTTLIVRREREEPDRRFHATTGAWLEVIEDMRRDLVREERERPQIPAVYVAGAPLRPDNPDEAALFKGRRDLVSVIDHDLADSQRAPLLLVGQRRMGKSSLVRMLPSRLGTGTTVVSLNFQALSGRAEGAHPHRWVANEVYAAVPGLVAPPTDDLWAATLDWLHRVDAALGARNHRLLVAIDEVERLETGIREGWSTPLFLDFARAAGDSLDHVRLLLVSAHPLDALGGAWTDRLISATQRSIGYLERDEAELLVRQPVPDFPAIYPADQIPRIVDETRCHPYLIQLVCDEIVRDLNAHSRNRCTAADVTGALDRALDKTPLFRELWRERSDEERALLSRMASAPLPYSPALRPLLRHGLVEARGPEHHVAVPLFARWIRERA